MNKALISLLSLLIFCSMTYSQEGGSIEDLMDMSLEELLNMEISVASKEGSTIRESPGIVTLITKNQIQKMGARDLIDVLNSIPGFAFAVDVEGIVGLGIRGNWGHEGKVLLLIDGEDMNENLFSTTQFGRHYPVDLIERIEIIRGPGSALYGGYAELSVINLITKENDGLSYSQSLSWMKDTYGQRNISSSIGQRWNDLRLSVSFFLNEGNRSDQTYKGYNSDYTGVEEYSMKDHSALNSSFINISLKDKYFSTRLIFDQYIVTIKDGFDAVTPPFDLSFQTIHWSANYEYIVNSKLTLTPKISFKRQTAWNNTNLNSMEYGIFQNIVAERLTTGIVMDYYHSSSFSFISGFEMFHDWGKADDEGDYFSGETADDLSKPTVRYSNYSVYSQVMSNTKLFNTVVGGRFENNSEFGSSFVPRLAITKVFNKAHLKFLASQAFRSPGLLNVEGNKAAFLSNLPGIQDIEPEKTTVFEFEFGYKISQSLFLSINFFDITIDKPIIYFFNGDYNIEGYNNENQTGSSGMEFEAHYNSSWLNINFNWSHYLNNDKNKVEDFSIPDINGFDTQSLLGFSRNKIYCSAGFHFNKDITATPSLLFMDKRYGLSPENEFSEVVEFDSQTFINFFLSYNHFLIKQGFIGIGLYNITDEEYIFIQPYKGGHAPLPGPSREIMIKWGYQL